MIDLIHNPRTGFALVHDEDALNGAKRALVGRNGDIRLVVDPGRLRRLTHRVPADLVDRLRSLTAMPLIRVDGMHAVTMGNIAIYSVV